MARAPRRRPIAAAVLALTGLVAGCSGGEDPVEPAAPEPTPTATATAPSASPSPSPSAEGEDKPERPAAMEKHDAEGAAAAAEYFLALRSYIMRTGDIAEWEAMSHETCGYCESGLNQAQQRAERMDRFEGGEITAKVVTKYERDAVTGIWPLDVEVREEAITITDTSGGNVFSSDTSTYLSRVEVGLVDDQWVIVEVASVPEE